MQLQNHNSPEQDHRGSLAWAAGKSPIIPRLTRCLIRMIAIADETRPEDRRWETGAGICPCQDVLVSWTGMQTACIVDIRAHDFCHGAGL